MYRVISDYNYRFFAYCSSCYWTATIFSNIESYECPFCPGEKVELMPLNLNEKYEYQLEPNKGLEIKIWTRF
jgi:hypothetical protein